MRVIFVDRLLTDNSVNITDNRAFAKFPLVQLRVRSSCRPGMAYLYSERAVHACHPRHPHFTPFIRQNHALPVDLSRSKDHVGGPTCVCCGGYMHSLHRRTCMSGDAVLDIYFRGNHSAARVMCRREPTGQPCCLALAKWAG